MPNQINVIFFAIKKAVPICLFAFLLTLVVNLSAAPIALPSSAFALPTKKSTPPPSSQSNSLELREKAEQELSLQPLEARLKAKASQQAPLQVKNLPNPDSIVSPTFTEAAITFSELTPAGTSTVSGQQSYDLSEIQGLPVVSGQIQHWLYKDFERQQHFGFLLGTSLGEKTINVALKNGYTLGNVEILYMKLMGGLSLEKTLIDERFHLGLSGMIVEELWQQNASAMETRWSRWNPSLALNAQAKIQITRKWYTLLEGHKQWPLQETSVTTSAERVHLGLGYFL